MKDRRKQGTTHLTPIFVIFLLFSKMAADDDSASGTECETADKMTIYKEKFEEYNKKFNGKGMAADRMSFRSFKHLIIDIKCLKNINRADLCGIFDRYSKEGTPYTYIEFPQLRSCLDGLVKIEAERTKTSIPDADTALEKVFEEIKEINPNNGFQRVKSLFATIWIGAEDPIKDVANATGNTLRVIAKTTVEELTAVGTSMQWIGPVIVVINAIWKQFEAFRSVKEDAAMFADTLLYLSDTVAFIGSNELYHTDMMEKRMERLKKILDRAEELWKKVDEHKDNKGKRFFTAKKDCEKLDGMMKEIKKWVLLTLFLQSAENQEITLENKSGIAEINQKLDDLTLLVVKCLQEFLKESNHDQMNYITTELKAAGLLVITEEDNRDATATGEGSARRIKITYDPSLSFDHLRPSDLLIYHDYDDKDLALDIQRELTDKMKALRLPDGRIERVKVRILDEYQSEGVQHEQLEKALNLASVKLILVTRKLAQLKGLEYHHLDIFSILKQSRSGQVFALRVDKNYKDYIKQLDFYVQGLSEGCFYEPHREDFVERMFQVFKRNIMTRIEREKQLDKEEKAAKEKQRMQEMIKEKIEEKKKAEKDKELIRIQEAMDNPNNTMEDLERLEKRWDEMMKITH